MTIFRLFIYFVLTFILFINFLYADIVKKIEILNNDRITDETIEIFSSVSVNDQLSIDDLNNILKNIYDTGFFNDVKVLFENGTLTIDVLENPIIQNLSYEGIKSNKIKDEIIRNTRLRPRSSYNEIFVKKERDIILNTLNNIGYYFAKVDIFTKEFENNTVDLIYKIELGKKTKISKISFIGNKIFKDGQLKRVIISEEFKFWKFLSGKKYLNQNIIDIDNRLLKNFYLNRGYYNVVVNSSFAKLTGDDTFEVIYNIEANQKIYFNELKLDLPDDFNLENFTKLENIFLKIKNKPYSLNYVETILDEIKNISLYEQYVSINATIKENIIDDNKLNIVFEIQKDKPFYVEKINVYGNNITDEAVIRNQLYLDEGDPYNEILKNKSINEIKNTGFFKDVSAEVLNSENDDKKIINISVEEKPTGEIGASAGVGTSGSSIGLSVRENNFLGKGIGLDSNLILSSDSVKGLFSVNNPNFMNSDKSVYFSLEASTLDKFDTFGYKTNKKGFSIGTKFEFYDDLFLGVGTSNYYETIDTDATASDNQKKQTGNYWDTYLNLDFDLDKRNQKFQTSSGYRSYYSLDVPFISEKNSLINRYNYQYFTELFENNITNFSLYLNSVNSLSNDDVKLSERLFVPSTKLRGFQYGSTGPKDGNDYVGGNYISTFNISSTLPQILENSQNTDFLFFIDVGNIWGVDYDSSINDSNKIRSSVGVGVDWFTPVGPLNFSLAQPITKASTDTTETFRFNIGTTF